PSHRHEPEELVRIAVDAREPGTTAEGRDGFAIRQELRLSAAARDTRATFVVEPSTQDLVTLVDDWQRRACGRGQHDRADDLRDLREEVALPGSGVRDEHPIVSIGWNDPDDACLPRRDDRAGRGLVL